MGNQDNDLTPEEEQAEWVEWVPEIIGAIEVGYLDDFIGQLQGAISARRVELGGVKVIKKRRKVQVGTTAPVAPATSLSTTPGLSQPPTRTARYSHSLLKPSPMKLLSTRFDLADGVTYDGIHYSKHAVAKVGRSHPFLLMHDQKRYEGCIVRVIDVDRVNCKVEVLDHIKGSGHVVSPMIRVPMVTIVRCLLDHEAEYGVARDDTGS